MSKTVYKITDKPTATAYDDTSLKARITALENKPDNDKQTLTFNAGNRNLSISNGNTVTIPELSGANFFVAKGDIPGNKATTINKGTIYNGDTIKVGDTVRDRFIYPDTSELEYGYWKVTAVTDNNITVEPLGSERYTTGKPNQTLTLSGRTLSISGGNSVTLPNDKQTISKQGNKLVLSNGGGEVDLPTPNNATPYDDTALKRRVDALEKKEDKDKQTLTLNNNVLSISNGNSVTLPAQGVSTQDFNNLKNEYNQLKGAFEKLLQDLKGSGAWKQTGGTIFEGNLYPDRHIATGNINLFGGTVDGSAFIRTNNGKTENDLAGGIN